MAEEPVRPNKRVQKVITEPSRAKQAFKDECDINTIMSRYRSTGVVTHVARSSPLYGDFTEVPDLRTAMDVVLQAEADFGRLPARVRAAARNNAGVMAEMLQSAEGRQVLAEAGLQPEPAVAEPQPPAPPPPSPAAPEPPTGGES